MEEAARTRAGRSLWATLWHQGEVYEATACAAPFLLEVLSRGPSEGRAWLLFYLSALATGEGASEVHVARGVSVRDAVMSGRGIFTSLLTDEDPEVRMNAAHLLGVGEESLLLVQGELERARALDGDERVRATALLAMCRLSAGWPRAREAFESSFFDDSSALVRWCAAREWARADAASTPGGVADVLASALFAPAAIERSWASTPWARGQVVAESAVAMARLGGERARVYVEELGVAMSVAEPIGAIDIAESLVLIAFEGHPPLEPFTQLTGLQRRVIEELAACDRPWTFNGNMAEMLRFYHLPARRNLLRAFITGEPAVTSSREATR